MPVEVLAITNHFFHLVSITTFRTYGPGSGFTARTFPRKHRTPLVFPRLARITPPSTLPSFSRQPLLSTTTLTNNQNLLMPAPPLVSAALTPPQLTYSARMRTQSIAPPVVSLLNLAGESRILPVQGRTGCDASTLPCSRIRHRDSTLPQFRYFMLNEK